MNTKLLRKIQQEIRKEPRRLDMSVWIDVYPPRHTIDPPCGTTACIAGFATILASRDKKTFSEEALKIKRDYERSTQEEGGKTLLLTPQQSSRLFFVHSWPEKFRDRWYGALTKHTEAEIACERIEHFIKTRGAE
jgi:hypothetical protein